MANIFRPSHWLGAWHGNNQPEDRDAAREPETRPAKLSKTGTLSLGRSFVHPGGAQTLRERIEQRAYFEWCEAGCPQGRDLQHWLNAEHAILEENQSR